LYDYIIVGAGSAGCVLANRLSADGRYRVLLLEAGGSDKRLFVQMPIGYGKTYYQKAVNWMYQAEPSPGTQGRPSYWPRGKVLGGSSSINAMVYVRGNRQDFDDWAAAGNPGWAYDDVLPYFKSMETWQGAASPYRGHSGPVKVSNVSHELHPLCDNFVAAGQELGLPFNGDMNGGSQEGVGFYQLTTHKGQRMSAARAYLWPARARSNLKVIKHAQVTKLLLDGKQVVGVEYEKRGRRTQVHCQQEVILSAGSINTPQIMQLSGIGPEPVLQQVGIDVQHASPAVGQNLQDHLGMDYLYSSKVATLNQQLRPWYGKLWQGLVYSLTRKGPLSLSVNQAGGFVKTQTDLTYPNIQLYFSPVSYTRAPVGQRPLMNPDPFPAFLVGLSNCRPKSRGQVNIQSADPLQAPKIEPNYLSHDDDVAELLAGVKMLRELAQMPSLTKVIGEEIRPGIDCQTDAQLIDDIRGYAWTVFHPTSTCRMGPDPATSVVDHQLRVHGLQGLRIADASIFPQLICGNTNAACMMVGEKAAHMILSAQADAEDEP
jgi:choline dehydrogenase